MSLLTRDQLRNEPLTHTDAGIVLKEDGTFRVFNLHKDIDPQNVTEAQSNQMKKVMALAFALQDPEIMEMLYNGASQVQVVDLGPLS